MSCKGGTLTGNALSFPAAGQTWPALTGLFLNASIAITPKDITGKVDANGKIDFTLQYDLLITLGSAQCTLSGTTQLSSQGVETLGGQASGTYFDPAPGRFGVVTTACPPPAQSGNCPSVNTAYDLSKGVGWYLTGTMELPRPRSRRQPA